MPASGRSFHIFAPRWEKHLSQLQDVCPRKFQISRCVEQDIHQVLAKNSATFKSKFQKNSFNQRCEKNSQKFSEMIYHEKNWRTSNKGIQTLWFQHCCDSFEVASEWNTIPGKRQDVREGVFPCFSIYGNPQLLTTAWKMATVKIQREYLCMHENLKTKKMREKESSYLNDESGTGSKFYIE